MDSPRHVLCLLHRSDYAVAALLRQFSDFEFDADFSQAQPDARMPAAFDLCRDLSDPSFTEADVQAVASHQAVSYVLSPAFTAADAMANAERALALVAAAFQQGVLAVKSESAGITHGRSQWLTLHGQLATDPALALCRAWVRWPLGDAGIGYSCGMHLLGLPDVEVMAQGLPEPQMVAILQAGLHYLIRQRPATVPAGKASLSQSAQRCLLSASECLRYEAIDVFHNPRGYLRATPLGADDQPLPSGSRSAT